MELRQRRPRGRDPRHLGVVAGLPSVISGAYGVQVCHIRFPDSRFDKRPTGMSEKPSDRWVLPLTPQEHMGNGGQHTMNERIFWRIHKIDATALANCLFRVWEEVNDPLGAQTIMRNIILLRIGSRNG